MPSSYLILPIICLSAHRNSPAQISIQRTFIQYPPFPTFLVPGPWSLHGALWLPAAARCVTQPGCREAVPPTGVHPTDVCTPVP